MESLKMIFVPKVEALLSDAAKSRFKGKIVSLAETDSTNNYAKNLLRQNCADGTVVAAESQTGGKGSAGKTFFSPAHTGLYFSVVLRELPPTRMANKAAFWTVAAAVAVRKAVKRVYSIDCGIKWVNDLYFGSRKVGGILAEGAMTQGRLTAVVLGVGLNVTTDSFPADLQNIAGSISKDLHRNTLLAESLNALCETVGDEDGMLADYRAASILTGKKVTVTSPSFSFNATVEGIDDECRLVVADESGRKASVSSGQVHVRLAT